MPFLDCITFTRQIICDTLEKVITEDNEAIIDFVHRIERKVQQFAKSVLIDAELLQYRQHLLVAGLFFASIEIELRDMRTHDNKTAIKLSQHLRIFSYVWEQILLELFEKESSIEIVENFGRYIVLRQQNIFEIYGNIPENINRIYVDAKNLYTHDYFGGSRFKPQVIEDVFGVDPAMQAQFEEDLQWCK